MFEISDESFNKAECEMGVFENNSIGFWIEGLLEITWVLLCGVDEWFV